MEENSKKTRIIRMLSIVLPIVLIIVLAVTLLIALKLSNDLSALPVYKDLEDTGNGGTTSNTEDPDKNDTPVEEYYSKGLFYSSLGNGTCNLAGIGSCTDSYLIVPKMNENGELVVGVADGAFKNLNTIRGIELSDSVTKIGAYAFYGSSIKSIEIGARISSIGSYALCACRSLENITVSDENLCYSSLKGVLYNKNGSELIAYPAGKGENSCVISMGVEKISNMAFYFCSDIKKVTYYGSEAQWKTIDIGAGNDVIEKALLFCVGSEGK